MNYTQTIMTRSRFFMTSVALLGGASLIGLLCAPPQFLKFIAHSSLPFDTAEWLSGKIGYRVSNMPVFLPFYMLLVATVLPALPAFFRLHSLGRHRAWGLAGLLPWLNFLFFAYLLICADKTQTSKISAIIRLKLILGTTVLCAASLFCYFYLLLYFPWLASKS